MTLLVVTRPLTLTATWNKSVKFPFGGMFSKPWGMDVSARGSFKRSEHGMTCSVDNGWVGIEVEMTIGFEGKRE